MNRLRKTNSRKSGFTIVELIVVIVVIAILATITLVSYNIIRDRAKATAIASEITKVEEAFHLMASDQFVGEWWRDNEFTGYGNPYFADIIASTDPDAMLFKKYIPDVPTVSGMNITWAYDNDKDEADASGCYNGTNNGWTAVVLVVYPLDKALQQLIDDDIDDGDLNCGRVREDSNDSRMLYQLSFNQKM